MAFFLFIIVCRKFGEISGVFMKLFLTLFFVSLSLLADSKGFFITVGGINGEQDGHKLEGQFGTIYKTSDLSNWKESYKGGPVKKDFSHAKNNLLRCMAYGNSTFVAIGNPKCVIVSKDGKTWKEVETPHGAFNVAFGNGIFVAGTASNFMTSKDGETWETVRMDKSIPVWGKEGAGHIRKIVYGNGVFICYGEQRIGVTKDCKTFIDHKIITDQSHRASVITFGNGKFIWLNPVTGHKISSDGIKWTPLVINSEDQKEQKGILWTGDKFLVKAKDLIYSSTDGEAWESFKPSFKWCRLTASGNGKLVSFHGWDSTFFVSEDGGKNWGQKQKTDIKARQFYFFNGKEIIGLGGG